MPNIAVPWSLAGILFIIVVILFLNPDKAQIWGSVVSGKLASFGGYFRRRAISGKLQGKVNQFADRLEKESSGIMPFRLKVEWVKNVDREAILQEEGIVIVRLGHHHNELQKALALAMHSFSSKAIIPNSRPYLSDTVVCGIDLVTTKKMLHSAKESGSLDYFLDEIVTPAIAADDNLRDKCQVMELLDERGFFSRILLREYKEMGRKMYPRTPDGSSVGECEEFLKFLNELATRTPGEEGELDFRNNRIRVAILLVARAETMEKVGYDAYIRRIQIHRKNRIETVYILGSEDNISYVRQIGELAEKRGLGTIVNNTVCKIKSFRGRPINSICISLSIIPEEDAT